VLLHNCPIDKAKTIAHTILTTIQRYDFFWGDRNFKVSASIGLIQIHGHEELSEILSLADMACYVAKDSGRNRIHVHTETDKELNLRRGDLQWLERLQNAMKNGGLVLYRQKIKTLQGESSHSELLLRMLNEDGKVISPDCFIPAAERFNLMPEIDRWVIRHACEQVSLIRSHNNTDELGLLFINLSATSLSDAGLIDYIQQQFIEFDLSAGQFGFEITETAAITDFDCALNLIKKLRELGCKLALDDFGTGMSSFSYLKALKVDFIKIDGSFVRSMLHDKMDLCFVEAITKISHVAGIKCIAEFVETDAIQQQLIKLGVDFAQGYAIEHPHLFTNLK